MKQLSDMTLFLMIFSFIAAYLLGFALSNGLIGVVLGLAAAATMYFVRKKKGAEKPEDAPAPAAAPDPVEIATNALLDTNLALRRGLVQDPVASAFESLVDKILALLPRVHDSAPGGDLDWTISRIATEYLPNKSLSAYLALEPADRASLEAGMLEGLAVIESEIDEIEAMVSRRQTDDFDAKAEFLKRRFDV